MTLLYTCIEYLCLGKCVSYGRSGLLSSVDVSSVDSEDFKNGPSPCRWEASSRTVTTSGFTVQRVRQPGNNLPPPPPPPSRPPPPLHRPTPTPPLSSQASITNRRPPCNTCARSHIPCTARGHNEATADVHGRHLRHDGSHRCPS